MVAAPKIESYHEPPTLAAAAQALSEGPATLVAGGTIVMRETQAGRMAYAPTLINLQRIDELRGVESTASGLRFGALTRLRDLNEDAGVIDSAAILARATRHMASSQVRNLGTVGGNLCWASPSADLTLAFLLLDAEVELVSWSDGKTNTRLLPVRDFLVGPEQTARQTNEILAAVTVPTSALDLRAGFYKSGTRIALDTTLASVGVVANLADGALSNARIGFGGVAATAIRAARTEALVSAHPLNEALIEEAVATARDEVDPPSDTRASAWYRRELIATFTRRALQELAAAP